MHKYFVNGGVHNFFYFYFKVIKSSLDPLAITKFDEIFKIRLSKNRGDQRARAYVALIEVYRSQKCLSVPLSYWGLFNFLNYEFVSYTLQDSTPKV